MIIIRNLPPTCAYLDWANLDKNLEALDPAAGPLTSIISGKVPRDFGNWGSE